MATQGCEGRAQGEQSPHSADGSRPRNTTIGNSLSACQIQRVGVPGCGVSSFVLLALPDLW